MDATGRDVIARNNVHVSGNGDRIIVFAHGFGCDQNVWRYVAPRFENDHRVVLFDYVGAGASDLTAYNPQRYASLHGYAEDILDVCHALALEDVILVGHSVSSMIGLLAAIREPELFRALVFVAPSPRYMNDLPEYIGGFERSELEDLLRTMDQNYVAWANFLAPVIMQNEDRPELGEELERSFCSTDPVIARDFARATFFADNREDLPKLRVPALVLQCSQDALAPPNVGEYVHANTPRSTLRVLEATGHCPHMSAPEETAAAMREYLETLYESERDGQAA